MAGLIGNRKILLNCSVLLVAALMTLHGTPAFAQAKPERFWVAARYDGDRVIVYFDAVKFGGTMSPNARKIPGPVADGFFQPEELPASYISRFLGTPDSEHFAIGDRYDLLLGNGTIVTMKLTTLVGCETDEEIGNDSFIGALGTVEKKDVLAFTKGYYAVRRHQEPESGGANLRPRITAEHLKNAGLRDDPVRFDTETKIAGLLEERMRTEVTDSERRVEGNVAPAIAVQSFQLADGGLRYYVRAEWKSGHEGKGETSFVLAVWMTAQPTLHILAVEKRTSPYDFGSALPQLLNVVDIGDEKTRIIVQVQGEDSTQINLEEYHDGFNIKDMTRLQSVGFGE